MAILEKVFPKQSEEAINAAALKRVEELKSAHFEVSRSRVAIASLVPFLFLTFAVAFNDFRRWILLGFALSASIGAAVIFRKEQAIVTLPGAMAAKVTRVVRRPSRGRGGGGYAVHYVFLAQDQLGYTGTWRASAWEGTKYSSGMLVPVLYDRSDPQRNRAWCNLSFYRIV